MSRIDRHALVTRHNAVINRLDPLTPLTVGNGEFAFTADITGLQSFPECYENGLPLCTQSQWGWHQFPPLDNQTFKGLVLEDYPTYGRSVAYPTSSVGQEQLYNWLRTNPHRLHLGQVGLRMTHRDGSAVHEGGTQDIHQVLDLWTGILHSRFTVGGVGVSVETSVHPDEDTLAVSITSALVEQKRLSVSFSFPYGSPSMSAADWTAPDRHCTSIINRDESSLQWVRVLDDTTYTCAVTFSAKPHMERISEHCFAFTVREGSEMAFACAFAPHTSPSEPESHHQVMTASSTHWQRLDGGRRDPVERFQRRSSRRARATTSTLPVPHDHPVCWPSTTPGNGPQLQ